jgi:hypothetical protein
MIKYFQCLLLALAGVLITGTASADSDTQALHSALAVIDSNTEQLDLIGYQSVDQPEPDEIGATKYIILDFRADGQHMQEDEIVAKVGDICSQITNNQPLIHNLSALGYDMVSVAFDDHSQFDCL